MTRFVPLLTDEDPAVSSEGAIDPLGLYTIADALGSRLAPGVRERQSRPRWLTAIAAGMVLCEDFPTRPWPETTSANRGRSSSGTSSKALSAPRRTMTT